MAATFSWGEANGAGQTLSSGIGNVNWKSVDDTGTAYTSAPVTAGTNSFEKWQFGIFSGVYNTIQNGFYDNTVGDLNDTSLIVKGSPTVTSSGLALNYTTPSQTTNASLTKDLSTHNASFPTSAMVVMFSGTTPSGTTGKTASTTANPAYTSYITTQMQTTAAAPAGDTGYIQLSLRYDEN